MNASDRHGLPSPPLKSLVEDAVTFLNEVSHNNTRDWLTAERPRYEAKLKAPAPALLAKSGAQTQAPELKRASVSYDKDHPQAELLCRMV